MTVLLPLWALLSKSVEGPDGRFVGLANFAAYARTAALATSIGNSVTVAVVSTAICVLLAFVFAYGPTRTCMPFRAVFATVAQIPILAPSLLPAISLVYLFGNQGAVGCLRTGGPALCARDPAARTMGAMRIPRTSTPRTSHTGATR